MPSDLDRSRTAGILATEIADMKRTLTACALGVVGVASLAIADPPRGAIAGTAGDLAQMPLEELRRIEPPPGARIRTLVRTETKREPCRGPDLVVLAPEWTGPQPGPSLGFPAAKFAGWRASWSVANWGGSTVPGFELRVACEVRNVEKGTARHRLLEERWCGFSQGEFRVALPVPVGQRTSNGVAHTFHGYPMSTCPLGPSAPFSRVAVMVDPGNIVFEGACEDNNLFVMDLCLEE